MKSFFYYLKVLYAIAKASVMARLAYRLNGILIFVNMAVRLLIVIIFLQIVFERTQSVGNWTKPEVFLFYGVFLLADSIFDTLFAASLQKIPEYVEDGDLDLILVKPANPLFLISFKELYLFNIVNIIFSILVINNAFQTLGLSLTFLNFIYFSILLIMGLTVYYSIYLILSTVSFYTIRTPFSEMLETLSGIMRFPLNIFGDGLQRFFTFVLPLIFVVTVPAKVLLGIFDKITLISPLAAIVLFCIAIKFWNFSLKRYSSASS